MFAQLSFLTSSTIAKDQSEATQDQVYLHSRMKSGSYFASGDDWVAFAATESDNDNAILVKRYTSDDRPKRMTMHAYDLEAFKKNWYPNRVQYMGGSQPREEYPYIVLRGVTSDHVSDYIARRFREDNQRGSTEALIFIKDLTNALAYTVGNTDSSSFDISKVHLNDAGKLVVVDLEPCLRATRQSKNDMPYWKSWQDICIEVNSVSTAIC